MTARKTIPSPGVEKRESLTWFVEMLPAFDSGWSTEMQDCWWNLWWNLWGAVNARNAIQPEYEI